MQCGSCSWMESRSQPELSGETLLWMRRSWNIWQAAGNIPGASGAPASTSPSLGTGQAWLSWQPGPSSPGLGAGRVLAGASLG